MTVPISSPTVVEVFADIWCPYAHVGIRRFVHRRWAARRDDLVLHVRAWPLELVNGEPLDARHVAEQVDDLRRQVAPELFGGFDSSRFPRTTLPALDLVNDAYASGVGVGERASLAVRDALFERGDDISDPAVLERLRVDLALGPPRPDARNHILAEWAEGRRRGVVGSPHFFVGDSDFFCPTLQIERHDGQRHIRVDSRGFDEFFARCSAA
jgi:2-hydroxychromene-2-carboxylate isomerase